MERGATPEISLNPFTLRFLPTWQLTADQRFSKRNSISIGISKFNIQHSTDLMGGYRNIPHRKDTNFKSLPGSMDNSPKQ
ncbi:UNVERIFIED_CONTAM: hypothetical protein K2H54_054307 [Gekko kuhli]